MTDTAKNAYQRITDRIIEQLEQGVRPWLRPWAGGIASRPLRACGTPYRGINVVLLWIAAEERGFTNPTWMTYAKAAEIGGQVRKGEKSSPVAYFGQIEREDDERVIPFLKTYAVFNVAQIDGLPERFNPAPAGGLSEDDRLVEAERFFINTGADIRIGGSRAFYSPDADFIGMPDFTTFREAVAYYGTLAHEACHWTKHPSRLDRDLGAKRFGDEGYAMEELLAEIGSAFLSADLGIEIEPREDHAAYLDHWLRVLKADNRAIFAVASAAEKAVAFLHGLQPVEVREAA